MTHLTIRQDQGVTTRHIKRAAAAALVALTLLAVTACAPEPATTPAPAPTATTTPAESETEAEADGELLPADAKAGDILDAETAAELNENAYMASKPRAYPLPSGEHVLILPDQPLPQPVVDTLNARVVELKAGFSSYREHATLSAGLTLKEEQESKTGRTIIVVGYNEYAIGEKWGTTAPVRKAFFTEAEAVANAEAFIAAAPHRYQIIVLR